MQILDRRLSQVVGRGACRRPDGAARLVRSALSVFAGDFASHASGRAATAHASRKSCLFHTESDRRFHVTIGQANVSSATGVRSVRRPTLRVRVDPVACDAYGYCAELLGEMVALDEWGYPVTSDGPVPPGSSQWPVRRPGTVHAEPSCCQRPTSRPGESRAHVTDWWSEPAQCFRLGAFVF